jgi:uncharacterized protein (TIGR03382 family)
MRRALLVATLLAVPALVRAQTQPSPGQILFINTDKDPNGSKISTVECNSATATVQLAFAPAMTAPGANVSYQLYASNDQTTATGTDQATNCLTNQQSNSTTNRIIVKVGDPLLNPPSLVDVEFSTAAIATALGTSPCTGTGETPIYLCIQGQASSTNFATARGVITLSLITPDIIPQFNLPILPGNTRLTPSWSPSGTAITQRFLVQAVSLLDPTTLPTTGAFDPNGTFTGFDPRDTGFHSSGFVTGSSATVRGLQNDVVYALIVTGFTDAYSPGDPSNVVTASPVFVSDFWNEYKSDGGRETGGCASGVAGPLALLLLAGTLALVRRRK